MTPLRFRAWDKKNKRFLIIGDQQIIDGQEVHACDPFFSNLCMSFDGKVYNIGDSSGNGGWCYIEENIEIMQFTGLKDKNGKEIFEGDICRMVYKNCEGGGWYSKSNEQGEVYFDTHWGVKFDCTDHTQRTASHWKSELSFRDMHDVEIIGNIYENPELLK